MDCGKMVYHHKKSLYVPPLQENFENTLFKVYMTKLIKRHNSDHSTELCPLIG